MTDTTAVWDRIAGFWDDQLQEGNAFQTKLIMPATDALLDEALAADNAEHRPVSRGTGFQPVSSTVPPASLNGRRLLDCCCGNGNYARRLAARGASVTAFDGSRVFIDRAVARTPKAHAIDYRVIDATDAAALATLDGSGPFDAAVCSMALMDLATIAPLLSAVRRLLTPGGAFVWSVCHPCFNATTSRMTAEMVTDDHGRTRQRFGVANETYLSPRTDASEGMLNQPEPHPMFHRPIEMLLGECFAAGFVVDALREPAFPADTPAKNAFSWAKRPDLPPVLVVRLRAK